MTALYKLFYELSYRFGRPNWDRETVPPELERLIGQGRSHARALDLGCGTGTHLIYLARSGCTVVGVDFSSKAIAQAREKAACAGVQVDFRIGDVTRLDFLQGPFDIALDVGCFHGLSRSERVRYAFNLARLVRPGGVFLLWGFVQNSHTGIGLDDREPERLFSPAFMIEQASAGSFDSRASKWYTLIRVAS